MKIQAVYDETVRGVRPRGRVDSSDVAGDGRGVIGQLRAVGVMLLIAGSASVAIGAVWWWWGVPLVTTAAQIEDGVGPGSYGRPFTRNRYGQAEVVGHVVQADAVEVRGSKVWVYAPLISDRPGAGEKPRVYFGASAKVFDRAVAEQRFRGRLTWLPHDVRQALALQGRAAPDIAYVLQDNGFIEGDLAAGRAVVIWGLLLGGLGLLAFRYAS